MKINPTTLAITGIITLAVVGGSIIYHYRRETTSIEDKYMFRDSEEIDELYHQAYLDGSFFDGDGIFYSDNAIRDDAIYKNYVVPNPHGDIDGDGLTNQEEYEYGTDGSKSDTDGDGINDKDEIDNGTEPDNPDTDGDGINDSQDPEPNDPNKGGSGTPDGYGDDGNDDEDQPTPDVSRFYKHVCNNAITACDFNQDKSDWKDFVYAESGDLISFFIYIQLNESLFLENYTADLIDSFGSNLEYAGNAVMRINNNEIILLDNFQYQNGAWYNGLLLPSRMENTMMYEIYFETIFQPQLSQSAINLVTLEIDAEEQYILDRRAFVFKK